jgi:large conductance mechanosensitive channel
MTMLKEFRDFILKGNMLDLAVGVIIGAAFGKVITEFTGVLLKTITAIAKVKEVGTVMIAGLVDIGPLINSLISLLLVGFALFIVVKAYNTAKKRFEAPVVAGPPEVPADVKLLAEIRDLLKEQQGKA